MICCHDILHVFTKMNLYKKCFHLQKTIFRLSMLIKRSESVEYNDILNNPSVKTFLSVIGRENSLLDQDNVLNLVNQRKFVEEELFALNEMKEDDKDMVKLISDEKSACISSINALNHQILHELMQFDEDEHRDVIFEVTPGVGGKEAMHFASDLFEMYTKYFTYKRWQFDVQEMDIPEGGGIRRGFVYVSGRNAARCLSQESGVHRVQRVPATEKSGRVHTSTVTIAVLPQPTDVEVVINDKDLKFETKTSSGAGGQHVNKTESCVRITHIPTGIVIENQTDRSQMRNKKIALQRLRSKLYQIELEGFQSKTQSSRKEQIGLSMRSDKIRTYNFNQDRVTDHRAGISIHNLSGFLQGGHELDQLISNLIEQGNQEKLLQYIEEKLRLIKHR